jgi:hypothetical protein
MSKSRKNANYKIPRDQWEKLKGFDGLIELFLEEIEEKDSKKNKWKEDRNTDSLQIYNFLEYEIDRLIKLDIFLSKKIDNAIVHNQIDSLIIQQENQRVEYLQEIILLLKKKSSPFQQEIKNIFDSVF